LERIFIVRQQLKKRKKEVKVRIKVKKKMEQKRKKLEKDIIVQNVMSVKRVGNF
jgi:hypothetical protein